MCTSGKVGAKSDTKMNVCVIKDMDEARTTSVQTVDVTSLRLLDQGMQCQ